MQLKNIEALEKIITVLVIQPRYLVLNTISVHETKEMKSDYTRYLKWLEGN